MHANTLFVLKQKTQENYLLMILGQFLMTYKSLVISNGLTSKKQGVSYFGKLLMIGEN